ncbi:hypothetical protein ABT364_22805 [Massilia sp. SR12]
MMTTTFPPSARQAWLMALILFAPLGIVLWLMLTASHGNAGVVVVGVTLAGLMVLMYFILTRYSVLITPEHLVVRHSVYTLKLARSEVKAVSACQVASLDDLGLILRTNGVAGFGYLSGWFRRVGNRKTFCAVSQGPLWLLNIEGSAKCQQLALSASPETIRRIEDWARQ